MSGFKVNPTRKPVDPAALAAFTAGAEQHQTAPASASKRTIPQEHENVAQSSGKQTESLLFRLTKSDLETFNFVFENTNIKSKQKLLEAIILPEIHRRAKELGERG